MTARPARARPARGLFTLAQAAVQAVRAMCWLGILAALLAVPLVAHDRSWLLDSIHDADAAAVQANSVGVAMLPLPGIDMIETPPGAAPVT